MSHLCSLLRSALAETRGDDEKQMCALHCGPQAPGMAWKLQGQTPSSRSSYLNVEWIFFFFMVFLMLLTFGGGVKYTFIVHKSFVILTCTCKSSVKLEFIFIMESEIVLFNLPL